MICTPLSNTAKRWLHLQARSALCRFGAVRAPALGVTKAIVVCKRWLGA